MSHVNTTTSSSPNFHIIFNNALKSYERCTKSDLLAHPLAAQLQNCNSPSAVLALIRRQAHVLHQSQRDEDKLTKWLGPTVRVLCAFSDTLGEGVSLVCLGKRAHLWSTLLYSFFFPGILSRESDFCRNRCSSLSAYPFLGLSSCGPLLLPLMQLWLFGKAKTISSTSSSAWKHSSNVLKSTLGYHRHVK